MIPASKLLKYDENEYQSNQQNQIFDVEGQNEMRDKNSSKGGTYYNSKAGMSYYQNRSQYPEEKPIFRNTPYTRYDYRDDHFYKYPRQPSFITRQIHSISKEIERMAENNLRAHNKIMGMNKSHVPNEQFSLPPKRELSNYYHNLANSEKFRINELEIAAKKRMDDTRYNSELLSESMMVDKSFSLQNNTINEKVSIENQNKMKNPNLDKFQGLESKEFKEIFNKEDSLSSLMKSIDEIIYPQASTLEQKLKEDKRWQEDPDEEFDKLDSLLRNYKERNSQTVAKEDYQEKFEYESNEKFENENNEIEEDLNTSRNEEKKEEIDENEENVLEQEKEKEEIKN